MMSRSLKIVLIAVSNSSDLFMSTLNFCVSPVVILIVIDPDVWVIYCFASELFISLFGTAYFLVYQPILWLYTRRERIIKIKEIFSDGKEELS